MLQTNTQRTISPWLRFANLYRDRPKTETAHEFFAQFEKLDLRNSLGTGVWGLCAWAAKGQSAIPAIEQFARGVAEALEGIARNPVPLLSWRASTTIGVVAVVIEETGRIRCDLFEPWNDFVQAFQRAEAARIRICPECQALFYAVRITRLACSVKCNNARRVSAWREMEERRARRAWALHRDGKNLVQIAGILKAKPEKVRGYIARARKEKR